uniref:Uncharacterized protein n=1 Tax=Caenorhabditis japonica TaxID=281687 RepID=A0A8R1ENG8_CAEJA
MVMKRTGSPRVWNRRAERRQRDWSSDVGENLRH